MDEPAIAIKGIRGGQLLVIVGDGPWPQVEAALIERIGGQPAFFRGAALALQVGDRILNRDDVRKLKDKLAEHDVRLSSLLGAQPETIRSARRNELDTQLPENHAAEAAADISITEYEDPDLPAVESDEKGTPGIMFRGSLRSGRALRHIGHVLVIGDVNPGAMIIAGGDVVVWGRLRGTVHAGANGDSQAIVCALDLRPQQLRIANHVAIGSDERKARPHPEVAFVHEGQIQAREWGTDSR